MIIAKLMGGLGNQMFQYAAGRSLAHSRNTQLKLDLSFLNADTKGAYTKREYELGAFSMEPVFASPDDLAPFAEKRKNKITRILSRLVPSKNLYVSERGHNYQESFMDFPENTYLDGFWQSEKYFLGIAELIRKDFCFKTAPEGKNLELAERIKKTDSVSLHIRRGDYVRNKAVLEFHGVCQPAYYYAGLKHIQQQSKVSELFIFSDDSEWCRQNLAFDVPCTYVAHNTGAASFEDMRLMSLCRHHVIANSSFSWWGAWLDAREDKVVVAPQKWFAQPGMETKDIYPPTWIRLQ